MLIFSAVIKDTRQTILLKTVTKNVGPFKSYVNLFHAEAFLVHELSPLVFKIFSTTMHYTVMTKMILTFINIFQTLNINLLMYLKF